jgi:hypothetical protein
VFVGEGDARHAIGTCAFIERRIVELAAQAEPLLKRVALLVGRIDAKEIRFSWLRFFLRLGFEKNFCILLEERVKVRSERVLIGSVRNSIYSPAHWACSSVRQLLSLPELEYFPRERRQKRERRRSQSLDKPILQA